MLPHAQNALLKTLEEPPPASSFMLVSSLPDALLDTVRSRCPRLRFGPLPVADVAAALVRDHGFTAAEARAAADASDGSIGGALAARGCGPGRGARRRGGAAAADGARRRYRAPPRLGEGPGAAEGIARPATATSSRPVCARCPRCCAISACSRRAWTRVRWPTPTWPASSRRCRDPTTPIGAFAPTRRWITRWRRSSATPAPRSWPTGWCWSYEQRWAPAPGSGLRDEGAGSERRETARGDHDGRSGRHRPGDRAQGRGRRARHARCASPCCTARREGTFAPGVLSADAGRAAYEAVCAAVRDAQAGRVDAVATAPVNKLAFAHAGLPWKGHTDLLGHLTGSRRVAMMFWSEPLKVVLATVHVPLQQVPAHLTPATAGGRDRPDGGRTPALRHRGAAAGAGGAQPARRRGRTAGRTRNGRRWGRRSRRPGRGAFASKVPSRPTPCSCAPRAGPTTP